MNFIWKAMAKLEDKAEAFVIVTLLSAKGSAPQNVGAKAVICREGLFAGTVGGGKIEAHCIRFAQEQLVSLLQNKMVPRIMPWNLQKDIGMTCGGEVEFLFETHPQSIWPIAIFGAGHVSQALTRVLLSLNCRLQVIDDRVEWLDKLPASAKISRVHNAEPFHYVSELSSRTFFVVMTRGHATDLPILEAIFRKHPTSPYVGVMGSKVKASKIQVQLLEKGIASDLVKKLHCPIGLNFGSNDPHEIALSVAAELIQVRDT